MFCEVKNSSTYAKNGNNPHGIYVATNEKDVRIKYIFMFSSRCSANGDKITKKFSDEIFKEKTSIPLFSNSFPIVPLICPRITTEWVLMLSLANNLKRTYSAPPLLKSVIICNIFLFCFILDLFN